MELIKSIKLKFLLPVLIIFSGILIFMILRATSPTSPAVSVKERVWQVKTIPAKLEQLSPSLTLYGQVETPNLVNAAAPSKGRVLSVAVREGDSISPGQLLLSLDPRDYQPKVSQAKAKVAELQALIESENIRNQADRKALNHEQSLVNLELSAVKRAEMLKNKNLGSTSALELAQEELERQQLALTARKLTLQNHRSRLQQLQARLAHAEADLQLAELDLERSQVVAPFPGFVEKVQVAAGDQVKENQILLSFYPLDKLEVRAKIPAAFRHELQQSLLQDHTLSAHAIIAGNPVILNLNRVAGAADARGIDALFTLTRGNNLVRLGSTLSLALQRPAQKHSVAIPFPALYDNNRIYKLVDGRLKSVTVTQLGEYVAADDQVAILVTSAEIHDGDKIVITHLPNAINGLRVEETDFSSPL